MYRQRRRSSVEECFPPPPLAVGKKGVWERLGTHQTLGSGWMVDGQRRWGAISFISPSSGSPPPPRHPRLRPFRERGECICVYGKCWGCLLLKASRVEPLALSALHPTPSSPPPAAASLLLSPGTKNVLNARRLLQCQITKGKVEGWREEREMTNQGKLGLTQLFIF